LHRHIHFRDSFFSAGRIQTFYLVRRDKLSYNAYLEDAKVLKFSSSKRKIWLLRTTVQALPNQPHLNCLRKIYKNADATHRKSTKKRWVFRYLFLMSSLGSRHFSSHLSPCLQMLAQFSERLSNIQIIIEDVNLGGKREVRCVEDKRSFKYCHHFLHGWLACGIHYQMFTVQIQNSFNFTSLFGNNSHIWGKTSCQFRSIFTTFISENKEFIHILLKWLLLHSLRQVLQNASKLSRTLFLFKPFQSHRISSMKYLIAYWYRLIKLQ